MANHLKYNMEHLTKDEVVWAIEHDVIVSHCADDIRHMIDMENPEATILNLRDKIRELEKLLSDEVQNRLWANG